MLIVKVIDLGLMEFGEAFALQERLVAEVADGRAGETLLLLEHPPVYTIGSGGREDNILDSSVEAIRINRGGDVTFHGPGQLVGYPIINLAGRGRDLHGYLRFLEGFLLLLAADFGVEGRLVQGRTGVWTENGKLASIGVGVRRWVTMHGFALNVATDLAYFGKINPCGMADCPMTSLEKELRASIPLPLVKARASARFAELLEERLPLTAAHGLHELIADQGGGCAEQQL